MFKQQSFESPLRKVFAETDILAQAIKRLSPPHSRPTRVGKHLLNKIFTDTRLKVVIKNTKVSEKMNLAGIVLCCSGEVSVNVLS